MRPNLSIPVPTRQQPHTTSPPWAMSKEALPIVPPAEGTEALPRPKTRTEMLVTRREKSEEIARRAETPRVEHAPALGHGKDWWTLAGDYKENALDDLASSPRIQRYVSKRARAQLAGEPDPFNTHEVPLKKPSTPVTGNIARESPPPPDAEAYCTPKKTIERFTDEFFAWQWRLKAHGDLDERGKNKYFQPAEIEPAYSSLSSVYTGLSLGPKGGGERPPPTNQHATGIGSSFYFHEYKKPNAADVAREAIKQRIDRREAIREAWAAAKHQREGEDDEYEDDHTTASHTDDSVSTAGTARSSACSAHHAAEAEDRLDPRLWPPSLAYQETNRRRRYSRLCGYG